MGLLDTVVTRAPRPLPVIALVDVSGSMLTNGKIHACNKAMREMIDELARAHDVAGEIQLAVITFGGEEAVLHQPLTPVMDVLWEDMEAAGRTPMGSAMEMAAGLIEDREVVPTRSYLPTIVVISDGIPTDDWQAGIRSLKTSERASKAVRLAVAIQTEPGDRSFQVLQEFVGSVEGRIFPAREVGAIRDALEWVSMSVTQRAQSRNPNEDPGPPPPPDLSSLG